MSKPGGLSLLTLEGVVSRTYYFILGVIVERVVAPAGDKGSDDGELLPLDLEVLETTFCRNLTSFLGLDVVGLTTVGQCLVKPRVLWRLVYLVAVGSGWSLFFIFTSVG